MASHPAVRYTMCYVAGGVGLITDLWPARARREAGGGEDGAGGRDKRGAHEARVYSRTHARRLRVVFRPGGVAVVLPARHKVRRLLMHILVSPIARWCISGVAAVHTETGSKATAPRTTIWLAAHPLASSCSCSVVRVSACVHACHLLRAGIATCKIHGQWRRRLPDRCRLPAR